MIHVDGDIVCYRAASATDGKRYLYMGEKYERIKEMEQIYNDSFNRDAVEVVYVPEKWKNPKKILDTIMNSYPFSEVYVGGKANFRYKVATIKPYKGNRSGTRKPKWLDDCKQYLCDEYDAKRPPGPYETDDYIALQVNPGDTIATLDKDFLQLPDISIMDLISGKVTKTTEVSALVSLYSQAFTGDTADNIPGLFGVGEKSKLISNLKKMETEEEMFEYTMSEYSKRHGSYASLFLCENLKLLYLLRKEPLKWIGWMDAEGFYSKLVG